MKVKETIYIYGYTLKECAKSLNISHQALSSAINGGNMRISTLRRIAGVIGCNITDFFSDETTMPHRTTIYCPRCGRAINIQPHNVEDLDGNENT